MNQRIAIGIVGCFSLSVATVAILVAMSGILKDKRNSFLRLLPPHPVMEGDIWNVKYNTYYLAGGTSNTVYLGNHSAPTHMVVMNLNTLDTQHVRLNVHGIHEQKFWSVKVHVDSPYYYLSDGAVPILYKGNVIDWKAEKYLYDSIYFRDIIPMRPGAFALKSLSGVEQENILGKMTAWAPYQKFTNNVLIKQRDGVFCTDGMMHYDKALNRLVYLYYYRNQFMVMDTSLNLKYQGNTIDTIRVAKIETATMTTLNNTTHTLASPPFFVNKRSCVSGNFLFVNSNLLAKNEHPNAFDHNDVIDVYTLRKGKYLFSFYIGDQENKKMVDFRVFNDKMVVLYDYSIRVFELDPRYFLKDEMSGL